MSSPYQHVGFHFRVEFTSFNDLDMRFQSVSGLDVQIEATPIREGGENGFFHSLPSKTKFSDLVLNRGILTPRQSELTKWFKLAIENFRFRPVNLIVNLLGENHQSLMRWHVVHALPKSWKIKELNAERGEVLIETMTLSYNYFTFD